MAQVRVLPTFVVLQATHGTAPFKYLGVVNDGSEYQDHVAYSTDKVVNDQAKLAIEFTTYGNAHIRSCYNNKYWVRSSATENWIVAKAAEPVENQESWDCTLFRPTLSGDGNTVTFVHVQSGKTVGRRDNAPDRSMYLCLEPLATTPAVSKVLDYGSLLILPEYVSFKSVHNDQYLYNTGGILQFLDSDPSDYRWKNSQVLTNTDGHIYFRNDARPGSVWGFYQPGSNGKLPSDMIACLKDYEGDNPSDPEMLFKPFKVDKTTIALQHLYNNKFLQQSFEENGMWVLRSLSSTMVDPTAQLRVEEPVFRREVNVFEFHLDRAGVYDRVPLTYTEAGANNPEDYEQALTVGLSYTKERTSSWNTSKSWYINGSVSVTSKVPFIAEGTIEIGEGFSEQYDWGETLSESETVTTAYEVKVPPRTRAIVSVVATRGKCDVPFSYVQIDQMPNGDTVRTTMSDGVFKGMNSYNFDYQVRYINL